MSINYIRQNVTGIKISFISYTVMILHLLTMPPIVWYDQDFRNASLRFFI